MASIPSRSRALQLGPQSAPREAWWSGPARSTAPKARRNAHSIWIMWGSTEPSRPQSAICVAPGGSSRCKTRAPPTCSAFTTSRRTPCLRAALLRLMILMGPCLPNCRDSRAYGACTHANQRCVGRSLSMDGRVMLAQESEVQTIRWRITSDVLGAHKDEKLVRADGPVDSAVEHAQGGQLAGTRNRSAAVHSLRMQLPGGEQVHGAFPCMVVFSHRPRRHVPSPHHLFCLRNSRRCKLVCVCTANVWGKW